MGSFPYLHITVLAFQDLSLPTLCSTVREGRCIGSVHVFGDLALAVKGALLIRGYMRCDMMEDYVALGLPFLFLVFLLSFRLSIVKYSGVTLLA